MFSKEEKLIYSLSALKEVIETFEIDVFDVNVTITKNNHKYTINAYEEIEKCVVECINNTQPYKFEDLKDGMWVWDNQLKWCFEIAICKVEIKGYENLKMFKVKNYDDSLTLMIFEENRFFPVQMANVRCE